ncbi:MAG TPA: D-alanyl-D-alanine carboxypeptidase family protein [Cerasibacillus sp.]|uniref:D-alanyl-D-alanine carboxypeptidase family protein n=1 Tax=Cerasibacillus sp. TaxID=2498711 RepID=UPI002F406258
MHANIRNLFFLTILLCFLTACEETDLANKSKQAPTVESNSMQKNEEVGNMTLPDAPLQKGDQGDDVKAVQQVLKDIGYSVIESGIFDQETIWAITDIQLQQGDSLQFTGLYDKEMKAVLEKWLEKNGDIHPGDGFKEENGEFNPYEILALVNKKHMLPEDFVPEDLVVPDVLFPFTEDLPKKMMRKPAADALEKLFVAAEKKGLNLFAQSGYRSYERQEELYTAYVERDGEEAANKYSARPGQSEHQSGLAMDVTSPDVNFLLNEAFGETAEGQWLKEHCHEFGFIIRYPKGKESITEYQFEPWHLRYVGEKAAKEIMEKEITLEEYLEGLSY